MQWEAITAFSTLLASLVVIATAIYAGRQVKIASRATQLDAMMRLLQRYSDERMLHACRFVMYQLPERMRDDEFRSEVAQSARNGDKTWHSVLRLLNETGAYIELGLVEGPPIYYLIGHTIVLLCTALGPVIDIERRVLDDPHLWNNTEELLSDAQKRVHAYYVRNPRNRPSTGEPFTVEALLSRLQSGASLR
ncbi:MAG TPA: hypothetical protein VKT72_15645 [Candidatus Baltobacteraceae bacterium]|nr:hypothetical protein [Candidatus Baltobacteraceae bacterium]